MYKQTNIYCYSIANPDIFRPIKWKKIEIFNKLKRQNKKKQVSNKIKLIENTFQRKYCTRKKNY